jgi:hypothetical protein
MTAGGQGAEHQESSSFRNEEKNDAEQLTAAMTATIMECIATAPTLDGKVSALLDALDWIWSIKVDSNGAQSGRLTLYRRIFAVTAVGQFLGALGRTDLAEDFHALASILSDLDRGVVHKTIEKVSRKGGPTPEGSDVWRGRAYVAAYMDLQHRAGSLIKTIKNGLDTHQELRPLLDEKKRANENALGDAAETWREQFNSGAVDNFEATNTYNRCQTMAAACAGPDELKKCAEGLLWRAAMKAGEVGRDSS